jgi:ATP-dependent Clp protease protease subunit
MINTKRRLTEIYQTHTGKDFETLEQNMDRDYYLSAEEAQNFGLVYHVVNFRKGNNRYVGD